jgi:nucleotide-binding universal stress UspA family protein
MRRRVEIMYRTIVLALDGSEGADRAVPVAADLARRDNARVVIAHAQTRALETAIDAALERQVDDLRASGVHADVATAHATIEGREADAIAQIAHDHDADLVVIAGRGRSPFVGAVLGSVTQRLLHVSDAPVLVIPPAGKALQPRESAALVVATEA